MSSDRTIAAAILNDAANAVGKERTNHGDVVDSFTMIAELWSTRINHGAFRLTGIALSPQVHLTAKDVADMMGDVKSARSVYGDPANADNYVDQAGYAALAGMIATQDAPKKIDPSTFPPQKTPLMDKLTLDKAKMDAAKTVPTFLQGEEGQKS